MRALPLLIIIHTHAFAFSIPGIPSQRINPMAATDGTLARTGLSVNEDDDIHDVVIELNPALLHEAKVWGITSEEEARYVSLMQSKSGVYYQGLNLTPLDILGINARNETERTHFAELAATAEAQKVSKNIAWNNAFYRAYNALFKGVPIVGDFDLTPYSPLHYKPVTLEPNDRLFLFVKTTDAVKTILMTLGELLQTTPNAELHILLLNAQEFEIQQWANFHQIPQDLVTSHKINLNHGHLQFESLKFKKKKTPLLLLSRQGKSIRVDLGRF